MYLERRIGTKNIVLIILLEILKSFYSDSGKKVNLLNGVKVEFGNNVWIGGNVCVIPGVKIWDNTVISEVIVVIKDISSNVVAVGNLCRAI